MPKSGIVAAVGRTAQKQPDTHQAQTCTAEWANRVLNGNAWTR